MRGPIRVGSALLGVIEGLTGIPSNDPPTELTLAKLSAPPAEGLVRTTIPSPDPGPFGHRRSPWARHVTFCPTDAMSGFDIAGHLTMPESVVDLPAGAIVLVAYYSDPNDQQAPTVWVYRLEASGEWTRLGGRKGHAWARSLCRQIAEWMPKRVEAVEVGEPN
jgi:hypothetical protein